MSHLGLALLLSAVVACSGSKAAEPPAEVPEDVPAAAEPGAEPVAPARSDPSGDPSGDPPPAATDGPSAAPGVTQTLFVGPTLVDCQGEAPQKCLQVRDSPAEPYRNLYSGIAGFEHEPSYEYELKVEATPVPGAPADASSIEYRLIEVVAKRKVPAASH